MKRTVYGVLVCMLMILSLFLPLSSSMITRNLPQSVDMVNDTSDEVIHLFDDLLDKNDQVFTRQQVRALVNDAVVSLYNHGLLPKTVSLQQVQQVAARSLLRAEMASLSQKNNENDSGNRYCLVIGITTWAYFRPHPSILEIPFMRNLIFNSSNRYLNLLALPYLFRLLQPFKVGTIEEFGYHGRLFINGNLSENVTHPARGVVLTVGLNGFKLWYGKLYGGLSTGYSSSVHIYDNDTYAGEFWDPVGITGFIGINFFSVPSFLDPEYPAVFIGFAREVNFTYIPPWA